MIASVDDVTQVLFDNIQVHDSFLTALKTRLKRSTNVTEERYAQWQIVLMGATDTLFCVLITSLALWLEMHFRWNSSSCFAVAIHVFFTDDVMVPAEGKKSKEIASSAFSRIFKM